MSTEVKAQRKAPTGTITGKPSLRDDWETPERLLAGPEAYWDGSIPFDPCTSHRNPTGALQFCSLRKPRHGVANGGKWLGRDGLAVDWTRDCGGRVFVNPPYGEAIHDWLDKIRHEAARGCQVIALLGCSRWEQDYFTVCLRQANALCFIRGRVAFRNPSTGDEVSGGCYASMWVGFNVDGRRFRSTFEPLCGTAGLQSRGERSACFGLVPL